MLFRSVENLVTLAKKMVDDCKKGDEAMVNASIRTYMELAEKMMETSQELLRVTINNVC